MNMCCPFFVEPIWALPSLPSHTQAEAKQNLKMSQNACCSGVAAVHLRWLVRGLTNEVFKAVLTAANFLTRLALACAPRILPPTSGIHGLSTHRIVAREYLSDLLYFTLATSGPACFHKICATPCSLTYLTLRSSNALTFKMIQ